MRKFQQDAVRGNVQPPVTAVSWVNQAGGDWATPGNWSTGTVPNSNDAVTIDTTALETITHSTGTDIVYSLNVINDLFVLSGGSLTTLHGATFDQSFSQTGGVFNGGAVTIKGTGTFTGGATEGSTTVLVAGTVALANYTLGGAGKIDNVRTINQTGQITLGDNTGVGAAINNGAKGIYAIAGDYGVSGGAASATISNAGVLEKSAGNGSSSIGVSVTSTGKIEAVSGALLFGGPANVITGALSGAGQVGFNGSGSTSLTLGTTTIGGIDLYNTATLSLGGTSSVLNGAFNDESDGSNYLALGAGTFTINGAAIFQGAFGNANVSGTGALVLNGATQSGSAVFGGQLGVTNNGMFADTGGVTLGDGSGGVVTFTNAAGGVFQFSNGSGLGDGASTASAFVNQGLLENSAGGNTDTLSAVVTNAAGATISAVSGSLQFSNTLTNAGTIAGAGQVYVTGGATLGSGTALTVAQFGIYNNGSVTLATSLSYGGIFADQSSGSTTLSLGANTLTLSGKQNTLAGAFGTAFVEGTGTLSLAAGGTLTTSSAQLGGKVSVLNAGLVNQTGAFTVGDGSGNVAGVTNAAAGVWSIFDGQAVSAGNGEGDSFTNSGTFEKIAGTGTSTALLAFTNASSGTILASSGSIQFSATLANAGRITGAGQVYVSGTATLNAGTALTVAQFGIYSNGSVTLNTSLSYGGIFSDNSNGNTSFDLGASTLTLTGTSNSATGAFGNASFGGTGGVVIAEGGAITLSNVVLGGKLAFTNDGTVNQTGTVQLGDASGNAASIINAAGATWDVANASAVTVGASAASLFTNNGTLLVTAGTGTATLQSYVSNTAHGVINISTGALDNATSFSNAGTITGGALVLSGDSQTTLLAGSKLSNSTLDLYSNGTLTLQASQTFAGTFNDETNGTYVLNLNANNLGLSGPATFAGAFGDALITGSGTLSVSGATGLSNTEIGATASFANSGTITATGELQIGDGSSSAAAFNNLAGSVYDITADAGGLTRGASMLSDFNNTGLFEKSAGTGTTVVGVDFNNTGTITVSSGTVEFLVGTLNNTGTINGVVTTDNNGDIFISAH